MVAVAKKKAPAAKKKAAPARKASPMPVVEPLESLELQGGELYLQGARVALTVRSDSEVGRRLRNLLIDWLSL